MELQNVVNQAFQILTWTIMEKSNSLKSVKMKFMIGFLSLFGFLEKIQGQGWFLDSTYIWTEYRCFGFHGNCNTTRYTFATSPTLIDGNQYYEKLSSSSPSGNDWVSTNYFYRTDDSGKVYVSYFGNENLVYDYSIEVNDSFPLNNGFDNIYLVVDKIDSIQLENGEKRKQLSMRCSFDETPEHAWGYSHWIEGLGGLSGVYDIDIQECVADGSVPNTLCLSRNDTLLYDNPSYDSCWLVTTATVNSKPEIIFIFPNPANDQIQVSGIEHHGQVIIYNLTGEILYQGKDNPIDVHAFPSGMYILEVNRKGHYSTFGKFLKL